MILRMWVLYLGLCFCGASLAEEFSLAAAQQAWDSGDHETARRHWQALAERGDLSASNNLGHLYENGLGVERDFDKSFALYQRAAQAGLAVAQFNVGEAYAQGRGVAQDNVEALKWYMLAAQGNDEDAASAVARLQQQLSFEAQGEAALRMMQWRREHAQRSPVPAR